MDRADAFFVQVDAVRIDVCDGRRGQLLGQLIRGSGRRWQADVRLRKRLGLNGAAGSLSRMKALAVEGFAALEEQIGGHQAKGLLRRFSFFTPQVKIPQGASGWKNH